MVSTNSTSVPRLRKYLTIDALIQMLRKRFEAIPDSRRAASIDHSLADCLMAAFAMFSLKEPSLLAFDVRRTDQSLMNLYQIHSIPSDTQQREILDQLDPQQLNECFADVFYELQRAGMLKQFVFHQGHYLLAIDATGYFCSTKISCPDCLVKNSKSGKVEYSHQMVAAVIVHPDSKVVLPVAVEPIIQQDGNNKNDCERNAVRRLLKLVRRLHPKLKCIVTEDGLSSNGPHIADLQSLNFPFILGAKPSDHTYMFGNFATMQALGLAQTHRCEAVGKQLATQTQWHDHLQLNGSHLELEVKLIEHQEFDATGKIVKRFSWVTQLEIDASNVSTLVAGGRARWKIENETFNTLKNQGYHLDHNFGHGTQHLSTVFAMLMFLAFLVDQAQQLSCPLFQRVLGSFNTKRAYWQHLRSCFETLGLTSWVSFYQAIIDGRTRNRPLNFDTS
jgi:hypothetical protein